MDGTEKETETQPKKKETGASDIEKAFGELFEDLEAPLPEDPSKTEKSGPQGEEGAELLAEMVHSKQQKLSDIQKKWGEAQKKIEELEQKLSQSESYGKKLQRREEELKELVKDLNGQRDALVEKHKDDVATMHRQNKEKIDQLVIAEKRLEQCHEKYQNLKEKVQEELRQIRLREKDIENRLEIVKRDSQTLLREKDKKVLELKRRIDILQLDIETLQGRIASSHQKIDVWKDRMGKAAKALKLALTLLEESEKGIPEAMLEEEFKRMS